MFDAIAGVPDVVRDLASTPVTTKHLQGACSAG
jgi:hypothetical protein